MFTIEQRREIFKIATKRNCYLNPRSDGMWEISQGEFRRVVPAASLMSILGTFGRVRAPKPVRKARVNSSTGEMLGEGTFIPAMSNEAVYQNQLKGIAKEVINATFEVASLRRLRIQPRFTHLDPHLTRDGFKTKRIVTFEVAQVPKGAIQLVNTLNFETFMGVADFLYVGTTFTRAKAQGKSLIPIRVRDSGQEVADSEALETEDWSWGWQLSGNGARAKIFENFQMVIDYFKAQNLKPIESKMTLLHQACLESEKETVERELERGADIDAQDILGRTPMHLACQTLEKSTIAHRKACEQVVETLLKRGADIDLTDRNGLTPVDYLSNSPKVLVEFMKDQTKAKAEVLKAQKRAVYLARREELAKLKAAGKNVQRQLDALERSHKHEEESREEAEAIEE